jgi:predicted GNAT superfamily acetyltransferase
MASKEMSFLDIVQHIQMVVWGMDVGDTVSAIEMAILEGTGGYIGVAYPLSEGLTPDSWLGFVLGYGAVDGVLASQMLGTNPKRLTAGIGQHLKMLQAYEALLTGHHTVEWTFDPTRSQNAHLNITKLGAFVDRYVVNKYGDFYTELYGLVPSDRFVARWELTSAAVQHHLEALQVNQESAFGLDDIEALPTITLDSIEDMMANPPQQLKYEIPSDINVLSKDNPYQAMQVREEIRLICTRLLDSKEPDGRLLSSIFDPALMGIQSSKGFYRIRDFVSGFKAGSRRSFYIFTLKGD